MRAKLTMLVGKYRRASLSCNLPWGFEIILNYKSMYTGFIFLRKTNLKTIKRYSP